MSIAKAVSLPAETTCGLFRWMKLPEALEQRMRSDEELGITPLAVVATAGAVNTGAIDPLAEIAEIVRLAATLNCDCPVFQRQITHSSEFSRIVRNQGQSEATCMSGNEKNVCSNHRPAPLQGRTDPCIVR